MEVPGISLSRTLEFAHVEVPDLDDTSGEVPEEAAANVELGCREIEGSLAAEAVGI